MPSAGNPTGATDPNGQAGKSPAVGSPSGLTSCKGLAGPCSTTLTALPLVGCSLGDYAAQVTVGTQTFSMLMDSGSGSMGVAGSSCTNCSSVNPRYTPGPSAMDESTPVSAEFGSGNGWSGVAYSDNVSFGPNVPSVTMSFAEITMQTMSSSGRNFFSPSACSGTAQGPVTQGIFGLASTGLALKGTDAYLDDLKATGKLADAFSFQSCDMNGTLWFGGYDPTHISAAPQFTPMTSDTGFFTVTLNDIEMGGTSIGVPAESYGITLVDTGTSIMLAPPAVVDALTQQLEANAAFQKYIGTGFFDGDTECTGALGNATKAELDANLPPLAFKFPRAGGTDSITVTLPPTESYLSPSFASDGSACFFPGIVGTVVNKNQPTIVMGNSVMHSQIVIFDRAGGQLGLAPQVGCK